MRTSVIHPSFSFLPTLRFLLLPALLCFNWTLQAQDEEAPFIIFISENTTAETAIQELVLSEYNARIKADIRENDFDTFVLEQDKSPRSTQFEDYLVSSFRSIPRAEANARYNEIKTLLGLEDDDPADKGFTDLLEASGYQVYRSETIVTEDPITGAVTREHEFWGDIGEPYSADGDYRLSEEQIAFLSSADLIIMSNDVNSGRYAAGGREGGQASTVLIEQWNGLEVPIICMDPVLMATNEFGSWGWGWSYGFTATYNSINVYDREDIQAPVEERFLFPDLRPAVTTNDPVFLDGLTPVDDNRLPIYMDDNLIPFTPTVQIKFSNNENFNYPASANVILEFQMPSFFVDSVGEIPIKTPVMIEIPPNIPAFNPTGGIPVTERVAIPAERRLYFAAGVRSTGLYNLSETGETLFLNAVAAYSGGTGTGGDPDWYGYPYDEAGWTDTGSWFNGWVNVASDPWIQSVAFDKIVYVPDDSGWVYIPNYEPAEGGPWNGYTPDAEGWVDTGEWLNGWINVSDPLWAASVALDRYIYVPDASGWVYIARD